MPNVTFRTTCIAVALGFVFLAGCPESPDTTPSDPGGETSGFQIGMSQCNLDEPWRVQMNADIKAAEKASLNLDALSGDAGDDILGGGDLDDALEGVDPVAKERERLAMQVEGDTVKLVIRKRDYRLLEFRPR